MQDGTIAVGGGDVPASGWTAGTSLVDSVTIPSPTLSPSTQIKIVSFSIEALLVLAYNSGGFFGKLGKIYAAIATSTKGSTSAAPSTTSNPPSWPLLDMNLAGVLWNPADDPLPPLSTSPPVPPNALPIQTQVNLAEPLPLFDQSLLIGMWIMPSLLSTYKAVKPSGPNILQIVPRVTSAQYAVYYDDGR